ncbi:MAG: PAS domain S-box protein [Desulfobacterales bacterium]|nr:PAS domain S-box protein [Desulfobacterales bacterium]
MSLRTKIIGIIMAAMVLYGVASLGILRFAIYPSFIKYEHRDALKDADRVKKALKREIHHLDSFCHDWASWDDTYVFVQNGDPQYAHTNLLNSTFTDNKLNLIYILNNRREMVWGNILDRRFQAQITLTAFPKDVFPNSHPLLDVGTAVGDFSSRFISGLFNTEYGPMLVASRPVLTSDNQGPARGTMIMGRFLTMDLMETLKAQTGVEFHIEDLADSSRIRPNGKFASVNPDPSTVMVDDRRKDVLMVLAFYSGLGQAPGISIHIEKERTIAAQGKTTLRYAVLFFLAAGAVVLGLIGWLIQKNVLNPIHQLTHHMLGVGRTGDMSARLELNRNDELGLLGAEYDGMLALLEKKSRELSDDIQKRRLAEDALSESEDRYRRVLETVPNSISITTEKEGVFQEVNKSFTRISGYCREAALGRTAFDLNLFADPGDLEQILTMLEQKGEVDDLEIKYRRCDGKLLDTLFSARRLRYAGKDSIVSVISDISDRKKAEEESLLLATAIEQSPDMVYITDTEGYIEYVNSAFEAATGFSKEWVAGKPASAIKGPQHGRMSSRSVWAHLRQGLPWKGRMNNRRQDGTTFEVLSAVSPVTNTAGDIIKYVSVERDITEDIRRERQLRQTQKLEAMGTLAGGVAHDFNNILSGIIGFTEIALLEIDKDSPARASLQKVLSASERAGGLVRQILAFSRKGEQEHKPVRVRLIVNEALKLCRASLPAFIGIEQNLHSDLAVMGDPTQIHQVVMNLCTNAGHSMEASGGVLRVRLEAVELDEGFTNRYSDASPGAFVKLSVADTGCGIAPEIIDRLFDPFFTTKRKGKGTGLGLSVVHGIVEGHGGILTVASRPGQGSVFCVFLPVVEMQTGRAIGEDPPLPMGTERILFIDDEPFQVDLGMQVLSRLGYGVVTETDSLRALARFRADPDAFDLVMTDMTMPELTGDELGLAILSLRPDMPVILCTGYSERITESQAEAMGFRGFAMKPMVVGQIARLVRSVLDGIKRTGSD